MTNYLNTNWDYNSEKLVEVFDELPLWAAPFGLKLLEGIRYRKGIQALDIGFGAGFPLTEIAMRLGKGSKVYGIDPWEAAIRRTEKKIDFYDIRNVEIIRGQAEQLPLEDGMVDLIVSNNGLNNVSDLDQALSECSRVIKSQGQFIQTLNLNDTMIEFYSTMERVLRKLNLTSCLEAMQEQIYHKRKPLDQYLNRIKSYGFLINSVDHDHFQYKFVDGSAMLNHYFIRMAFMDGWKGIVPADKQTEVFERIELELNKQSAVEGIVTLSVPFVLIDCTKS